MLFKEQINKNEPIFIGISDINVILVYGNMDSLRREADQYIAGSHLNYKVFLSVPKTDMYETISNKNRLPKVAFEGFINNANLNKYDGIEEYGELIYNDFSNDSRELFYFKSAKDFLSAIKSKYSYENKATDYNIRILNHTTTSNGESATYMTYYKSDDIALVIELPKIKVLFVDFLPIQPDITLDIFEGLLEYIFDEFPGEGVNVVVEKRTQLDDYMKVISPILKKDFVPEYLNFLTQLNIYNLHGLTEENVNIYSVDKSNVKLNTQYRQ